MAEVGKVWDDDLRGSIDDEAARHDAHGVRSSALISAAEMLIPFRGPQTPGFDGIKRRAGEVSGRAGRSLMDADSETAAVGVLDRDQLAGVLLEGQKGS